MEDDNFLKRRIMGRCPIGSGVCCTGYEFGHSEATKQREFAMRGFMLNSPLADSRLTLDGTDLGLPLCCGADSLTT
jgi:hypothetical protein